MKKLLETHGDDLKKKLMDPVFFVKEICGLPLTHYQEEWLRIVHCNKRINFTAYRSSGKTEVLFVCYFIFRAFTQSEFQGIIISDSLQQSGEVLRRIREKIVGSEILRTAIPENRTASWSKTELELKNKSRILCKPYTDRVRGYHVDLVGCDESGEYRDHDIFLAAVNPLVIAKDGGIIVVGTPTSELDLLHKLRDNPVYVSRIYAANGKYPDLPNTFWSMRYPDRSLADKKKELNNSIAFSREFLCKPLSAGDSLFPYDKIEPSFDYTEKFLNKPRENCRYLLSLDFAMSGESGADFSVYIVFEIDGKMRVRIARIERYKGLSYQAQQARIKQLSEVFVPYKVVADEGTFGKAFVQDLRSAGLPVKGINYQGIRAEMLEVLRSAFETNFNGAVPNKENEKMFLIPRNKNCAITMKLTDELVKELTSFAVVYKTTGRGDMTGTVKFESTRKHDDIVMAAAMGYYYLRNRRKTTYNIARGNSARRKSGMMFAKT